MNIMKSLKERFVEILKSDCLNSVEKNHLKQLFRNFLQQREIIRRGNVESKQEIDFSEEWLESNIG